MDESNDALEAWLGLGQRLMLAAPRKMEEEVTRVRAIVEGQELIAAMDAQLVLRGQRPSKRYKA